MKRPLSNPSRQAGFTLIELVVTMAILGIMLIMTMQVTQSARNAIRLAESRIANDTIARRTFDRINRDLAQMLTRADARIEFKSNPGNDDFKFLTRNRGFTAASTPTMGERDVSLVSYSMVYDATMGQQLLRGTRSHLFTDTASAALKMDASLPFSAIPAANVQVLSNNVIRFEVEYLVQGGAGVTRVIVPPATSDSLRGLIITLVTLDDRGRRAIKPTGLVGLAANFPDASITDNTLKVWSLKRDSLAKTGITGVPKDALQSIRCYQRTFLIP